MHKFVRQGAIRGAVLKITLRLPFLTSLGLGLLWASGAWAQHSPQQITEDSLRHRAMAQAHSAAAQCISSTHSLDACLADLAASCSGLGIGKYCGLKQQAWQQPVPSLQATAKAHQAAAGCLAAGKAYEDCIWDLQSACEGLAIGKYCGLVHAHSF